METAIYMLGLTINAFVFLMVFSSYDEANPKRYTRTLARFFVASSTAYIIMSLFYAITKYVML